jgi:hypothetical protein
MCQLCANVEDLYACGHEIESQLSQSFCFMQRHVVLHYTNNYYAKTVFFSNIYYPTSLYVPTLSGTSVYPTSQVRSSAILVLQIARN